MRAATLARQIRRSLRGRVPRRPFRRSFPIFVGNLLKQRVTGIVVAGISVFAIITIIIAGRMWEDGGPSILMLNALSSAASVFLIANVKLVLDREDFPRLDTLAVVPWTDQQWLFEFLRGWRKRLPLVPCSAGVTLVVAKLATLPDRAEGWLLVAMAFVAQLGIVAAMALCVSNAAYLLARFRYLATLYHLVLISLLVATVAMISKQFAFTAISFAYPQALAVLPTAWPAGILYLVDDGLSGTVAFALLGLCMAAAMLIGALAIWGLKRSFKIIEIVQDPWGGGFVIRQSVFDYYSPWRDFRAAAWDGQEFANDDGPSLAAASLTAAEDECPPPEPMTGEVSTAEGEPTVTRRGYIGQSLDDFWKQQGWVSGWFAQSERDVLAFFSLTAGAGETPAAYFRRCVRAMLLGAAVVVIGPLVLDAAARDGGQTLLIYGLLIVAFYLAHQGRDASSPFRALPLSTSQWLRPPLKFQWLRLASVMPPGILLLSALLWKMGEPVAGISQWICVVVTVAFLLPSLALPIRYFEGCRDRWYSMASISFLVRALGALALLMSGVVLLGMLPWPRSICGIVLMAIATWFSWRTLCDWYDRGPVDAPTGSK